MKTKEERKQEAWKEFENEVENFEGNYKKKLEELLGKKESAMNNEEWILFNEKVDKTINLKFNKKSIDLVLNLRRNKWN